MDANVLAALGREEVYVQWFAWLDIVDDPVRAVSGVQNIVFGASETGDPDLDGHTFVAIPSNLVSISDVEHAEQGSGTVSAVLSGLPVEDSLLDIVEQRGKWRKREARLWFRLLEPTAFSASGVPVEFSALPIQRYYSGYLVNLEVQTSASEQSISASIENYQAALSEASGLTYLHQSEFDPDDDSAARKLAAANGIQKAGVFGSGPGGGSRGGGGGGGGAPGFQPNIRPF